MGAQAASHRAGQLDGKAALAILGVKRAIAGNRFGIGDIGKDRPDLRRVLLLMVMMLVLVLPLLLVVLLFWT